MRRAVTLNVNGEAYDIMVEPAEMLLQTLRNTLSFTGAKSACESGECGACTVIIDGKAVNACIYPTIRAEGKQITTVEGLAQPSKLHPIQEALLQYGATQCGYCTPGMILTAKALMDENPHPDEQTVREALAGNLCRCTGYAKIVQAITNLGRKSQ